MTASKHIAIIPDGNRRWAKSKGMQVWNGHAEGVKRFWDIANIAGEFGVTHLSIWAGSYDNLKKRTKLEVNFLLKLLRDEILNPKLRKQFIENKCRVRVIGEWKDFVSDKTTLKTVDDLEKETEKFSKYSLTLLFGYDGQREMLAAVNKLVVAGQKVTRETLHKQLWTNHLPDVDLVIRTGGEPHWSAGFMMWLTANSQYYFTEKLWPDFTTKEFMKALDEFDRRERRLGK